MGGGSRTFVPETERDKHRKLGARKDGKNLIKEWTKDKESRGARSQVIYDYKELKSVNPDNVDYLLGES